MFANCLVRFSEEDAARTRRTYSKYRRVQQGQRIRVEVDGQYLLCRIRGREMYALVVEQYHAKSDLVVASRATGSQSDGRHEPWPSA